MRSATLAALAPWTIAAACVLPSDDPTGFELSWRLLEHNSIDGEQAPRLRTCEGAFVDTVVAWVEDVNNVDRRGRFRYPCESGYLTPTEFQTEASDAFIELRPRPYLLTIDLEQVAAGATTVTRVQQSEVEVVARTITAQDFELRLEPAPLQLNIVGQRACSEATVALNYAEPARDLAEPDSGELQLYRPALVTDAGASLSGMATSCNQLARLHTVDQIDPGAYSLEFRLDGAQACRVALTVPPGGANVELDLANLPCAG